MKLVSYCHINNDAVSINNESVFSNDGTDSWLKTVYHSLGIDYPKFHKMDDLAKLAFLATEYLSKDADFSGLKDDELTLIFANSHSSYNTDNKFIHSYKEKGSPSPSLFVYTLPNILTGELAIRYKWYGENIFFILKALSHTSSHRISLNGLRFISSMIFLYSSDS